MSDNKIVGFTCSAFDLLHTGHVLMLEDAKKHCDYLIVGLHSNPKLDRPNKNSPIQSLNERKIQLKAVKYIDEILIYDTESDLYKILEKIKPDLRILGSDYKNRDFTGKDLNIPIYFHERNHDFSSSNLRKKIYKSFL
tara:strand:- start:2113 stop:2526 length:414 start_codon:yes stop_codon:yes gene_type:complete